MHSPPFAASLHFEVYKSGETEHYFQIYYRTSNEDNLQPMKIPGLGVKCTLKQFYEKYEDIIPTENYFEWDSHIRKESSYIFISNVFIDVNYLIE